MSLLSLNECSISSKDLPLVSGIKSAVNITEHKQMKL